MAKKPPLGPWKERSTRNKAEVLAMAAQHPGCNWLIDCGKSCITVLDEDVGEGKDGKFTTTMLEMFYGPFDKTAVVQTPSGGRHFYFRGSVANTVRVLGDGVDTRGIGGYVVCPGSLSADSVPYLLIRDDVIPATPDWLKAAIKDRPAADHVAQVPVVELDDEASISKSVHYLTLIAKPCIEGQGGDRQLIHVAGQLKNNGISDGLAVQLLSEYFNERCQPPWDIEDLERGVANAYHYLRESAPGVDAPLYQFPDDLPEEGALEVRVGAAVQRPPQQGGEQSFYDAPDRGAPGPDPSPGNVVKRSYRSFEEAQGARTYTAGDTKTVVPTPTEWIIPNWIPKGKVTLCSGDGGTAKSLCWLQFAYSLAAGHAIMGIPSSGRVPCIYVSCEDDMNELLNRQQRWAKHIGIWDTEEEEVPFMFMPRIVEDSFLCVRGRDGRMVPGAFYPKLAYVLSQVPESFVILDTAGDVFGGNDIDKEEVLAFLKKCLGTLSAKYGTTFLLLGHTSRAEGSEFAGSAAWRHGVRSHLLQGWAEDGVHLNLSVRKSNYAAVSGDATKRSFHFQDEVLVETDGMFDDSAEAGAIDYVYAAIAAAAGQGEPLALAVQAARSLSKVKIFDAFGAAIPDKVKVRAANDLISQGRVVQIERKRKGPGLHPADW